jgi:hypothetical protein
MGREKAKGYVFHHLGIPSQDVRPNERYSQYFKMYSSDNEGGAFRVEFHRIEADSSLPEILKKMPHVALKVEDLSTEILGKKLVLGPYEPIPGYRVAVVDDQGVPIELVQTDWTDEELWSRAKAQKDLQVDGLEGQGKMP